MNTEEKAVSRFAFQNTGCSQCGAAFGPGDHGYSHCDEHTPIVVTLRRHAAVADLRDGFVLVGGDFCKQTANEIAAMQRRLRDIRVKSLNDYADECHSTNQHWWHDPATGARLRRNKGELLMLIASELAECMEGERKDLMDTHLTHRKMAEVELADALIRIFDYAGGFGYDIHGAYIEKRAFNAIRPDHKPEARLAANGKKW